MAYRRIAVAHWALLIVKLEAPNSAMTEFSAAVDLTGWSRVEGMPGCWYGRLGRMNWRQAVISVERMLEIAALSSGVECEIPFVLHTGESAPHFGVVEAASNMGKSLKVTRRRVVTKRLPLATTRIQRVENVIPRIDHPTKKLPG
jgi:hypothetical protein